MSATGIVTLDHAPQAVAEWLDELCEMLGWEDRRRAFLLLRETLHATRDMLGVDEAADLAAQLPLLIRGIYYEGWNPSAVPVRARRKSDLLARIGGQFTRDPLDNPERAVAAVFDLLRRHVSYGEFDQARQSMRRPIRDLWD